MYQGCLIHRARRDQGPHASGTQTANALVFHLDFILIGTWLCIVGFAGTKDYGAHPWDQWYFTPLILPVLGPHRLTISAPRPQNLKFGRLTLKKIFKFVLIRCQILRLKCIKFNFGWGSAADPAGGTYNVPPDPLAGFKGSTYKRGRGRGGWERERGGESREEERRIRRERDGTPNGSFTTMIHPCSKS